MTDHSTILYGISFIDPITTVYMNVKKNRLLFSLLFIIIGVLSCKPAVKHNDTIQPGFTIDTINAIHGTVIVKKDTSDFESVDLKEVKGNWIKSYRDTITIDTIFLAGRKHIHLRFSNYCLFDHSLTIPENYVQYYGMDKFVSNNFASSVIVEKDGQRVLDTIIDKSAFAILLIQHDFISLYDYGALVFNSLNIHPDHLDINYTILIPLSDIGDTFKAKVFYDGRVKAVHR